MNLDLKILNSYYLEFVHNFVVEIRILQVAVQKAPDAKRPKCMDAGVPAVIAVVTNPMHLGKATDGLYGQTLLKPRKQAKTRKCITPGASLNLNLLNAS